MKLIKEKKKKKKKKEGRRRRRKTTVIQMLIDRMGSKQRKIKGPMNEKSKTSKFKLYGKRGQTKNKVQSQQ